MDKKTLEKTSAFHAPKQFGYMYIPPLSSLSLYT